MNINPVLLKELKVKMRGWKAAATIVLYLGILTMVAVFFLIDRGLNYRSNVIDPEVAISLYTTLAIIQFILIMFQAPALTSGAISGEREKQTLDLLLSTNMSSYSIILGKLFASLSHVILLIIASLPIFSIVFMFGGISIIEIIELAGFFVITSIMVGSIGIFFSTIFKRTTIANVLTYGMCAFLLFGTIFLTTFYLEVILGGNYQNANIMLMYSNPIVGFSSILAEQFGRPELNFLLEMGRNAVNAKSIKPWIINLGFDIVLSILLIYISAIKLNTFGKRRNKLKT